MRAAVLAAVISLSAAGTARAEVAETWDTGFKLTSKAELSVPAARAYAAIGVVAVLTFTVKPAGDAASAIELTYVVSGGKPGIGPMFAAGVDGVMSEALRRYEKYVETGKPE